MEDRPAAVIDGHCHVASTHFIPQGFLEDVAANMHAKLSAYGGGMSYTRLVDLLVAQHQDHLADELVRDMTEAGIVTTVLLAPDFSHVMRCECDLAEMALRHHQIRQRHPGRFHVFIGADPRNGPDGVSLFERCIDEYGFEGLKLYPPCGYSVSDRRLFPYYEICAARHLPVLLHTGPTAQRLDFRMAKPSLLDDAARNFPTVDFILAHGGVTHVRECAALCAYRSNVYLDVGGFTGAMSPRGWMAHLNAVFRLGINHKVIFGTDYPIFRMSGGLQTLMKEVLEGPAVFSGIRPSDRRRILHGNMARVLSGARAEAGYRDAAA